MAKFDESSARPAVVYGDTFVGEEAVSGVIHVIRNDNELNRFREGEILVATEIPDAWSHLFSLARAIVTETGELPEFVSDAAKALSLPVVAGVKGVTNDLRSGDIVILNTDGSIERLQEQRQPDSKMRVSVPAAVHARQYANDAGGSEVTNGSATVLQFKTAERADPEQQDAQLNDGEPRKMG